jgi:hypothetical protein
MHWTDANLAGICHVINPLLNLDYLTKAGLGLKVAAHRGSVISTRTCTRV